MNKKVVKKRALLVHGAYGSPNENWIPWLRIKLEKIGYEVIAPIFPTPENQNLDTWMQVLEPHLESLNEHSILIGHSIGATFLLSVIEGLGHPIRASIFVSGFIRDLHNKEFDTINASFYDKDFDWDKIKINSKHKVILHGNDDPYVSQKECDFFSTVLGIKPIIIQGGGHLNESAGFKEFPKLFEIASSFSKQNNYAFIDGQNLKKGVKNFNWKFDYGRFRVHLKETYHVENAFIFLGYLKEQEALYKYLRRCNYKLIFKDVAHDDKGKPKGNVDVLMTLDALLKLDEYQGAVIVTSDGDFAPLVEHLLSIEKLSRILSPEHKKCSWLLRKYAKNKVDYLDKARNKLKKHP